MPKIRYIKGDATRPTVPGNKIIAHICNDQGKWGAGFVLAVSSRWKQPEESYRECPEEWRLGVVQVVPVEDQISVANMIAQHGTQRMYASFGSGAQIPPIR